MMSTFRRQFEDGTVTFVRAGSGTDEDQDAIARAVLGPAGTGQLAAYKSPGGPARVIDAYEILRREVNALTGIVDALLVGHKHGPYRGNLNLVSLVPSASTIGQHLVDPLADDTVGLDPALHVFQSIHGETKSVEGNRPAMLIERWGRGDVSTDQYLVALRKRLADGATDDGAWIGDDIGQTWAVTSDGTYFTRGGLFAISGHAVVHAGDYYVDNGGAYVALGPGTTSESATGTAIALARLAGSAAQLGDPYGNNVVLTLQGSLVTLPPGGVDSEVRADGYTFRGHTVTGPEPRPTTVTAWGYGLWAKNTGELYLYNGVTDLEIPGAGGAGLTADEQAFVDAGVALATAPADAYVTIASDGAGGYLEANVVSDFQLQAINQVALLASLPRPSGEAVVSDGVGGWTWAATGGGPHAVLSATHSDTTAAAVQRGDLIVGKGATPKWERHAKGSINTFLAMGADEPVWRLLATSDMPVGTDGDYWQLNVDGSGPQIRATSGTIISARDATNAAYANVRALDAATADDLVTLRQLDALDVTFDLGHNLLAAQTGGTTASKTYNVPEGYLLNVNSGLEIDVYGTADGSSDFTVTLGGVDLFTPADIAGSGARWHIHILLLVTATNTVRTLVTYYDGLTSTGGDAVFGTTNPKAYTPATITLNGAGTVALVATDTGGTGDVTDLIVRYIGALPADALVDNGDTAPAPTNAVATCPTLMTVRHRGATPGLFRLSSGTTLSGLVGTNTVSAVEATAFATNHPMRANDWVEFNGAEYLLNTNSLTHEVYTRPIGGNTNATAVHTIATSAGTALLRTGLHVVSDGATKILCFVFSDSTATTGTVRLTWTTDGSSWTNSALGTWGGSGTLATIYPTGVAVNRGTLYVPVSTTTSVTLGGVTVNPFALTSSVIAKPSGTLIGWTFLSLMGRVFGMSGASNDAEQATVYEVVGGTLTSVLALANSGTNTSTARAGCACMFPTAANKFIVIYVTNTGATAANAFYRVAEVTINATTGVLTKDDAPTTNTILPVALRTAGAVNGLLTSYVIFSWTDYESDPTDPKTYIWYANSTAAAYTFAQYRGTATAMAASATGVTMGNFAIAAGANAGGKRISPDDAANVIEVTATIAKKVGSSGLMTFAGKAQIQSGTYTAKLFISVEGDGAGDPNGGEGGVYSLATLTGTPTGAGTARVGNTVTGITDELAWGVDVDMGAMGIPDTTRFRMFCAYYPQ
jgi:hypothetical protein